MTPEQITQAVVDGQLTHKQAIDVFSTLYGSSLPSSALMLPCERAGCTHLVSLAQVHSYLVWAPMPGHPDVAGFQCEHLQHFGCSEACAVSLAAMCLREHILPIARERRAAAVPVVIPKSEVTPVRGVDVGNVEERAE